MPSSSSDPVIPKAAAAANEGDAPATAFPWPGRAEPLNLAAGAVCARDCQSDGDLRAAFALRRDLFLNPSQGSAPERDRFDSLCRQILIEEDGRPVGTFRAQFFPNGAAARFGYAAASYDLSPFAGIAVPVMELGRLCIRPGAAGAADRLRIAWGAVAALAEGAGPGWLIGCTSLWGTDPAAHAATFSALRAHVGPPNLCPQARGAGVVRLADHAGQQASGAGQGSIPPLLRSYIGMGGWVSDQGVIDRAFGTIHLFTALDLGTATAAGGMRRLLRSVTGQRRL